MVDINREIVNRMSGSFSESIKVFDFAECIKIMLMRDVPSAEIRVIEFGNLITTLKGMWSSKVHSLSFSIDTMNRAF